MADVSQTIHSSEIRGMNVSDSAVIPKENESKVSTNLKSKKDSIPPRPEFSMGMEEYDKI